MQKLREQYEKEVVPALMKKFNYKSVMQVPKLDKIVINIGLGDTKENPKALENAMNDLTIITGQRPVVTKAKKSIAAFKLREGANIRKKHVKPRKQGEEGGIISVECAIPSSKVNVVCPKCGKTTKVGYSVEKDEKVRICKKCGAKLK